MPTYEMMLLVEPTAATKEWSKVVEEINKTVEKHGAKVLSLNKWGERKLTYPVRKVNRGAYVLTYFEGHEETPAKIKADFTLSETVMRSLVMRHEGEISEKTMPPVERQRRPARNRG